jgi:hypothetical protein
MGAMESHNIEQPASHGDGLNPYLQHSPVDQPHAASATAGPGFGEITAPASDIASETPAPQTVTAEATSEIEEVVQANRTPESPTPILDAVASSTYWEGEPREIESIRFRHVLRDIGSAPRIEEKITDVLTRIEKNGATIEEIALGNTALGADLSDAVVKVVRDNRLWKESSDFGSGSLSVNQAMFEVTAEAMAEQPVYRGARAVTEVTDEDGATYGVSRSVYYYQHGPSGKQLAGIHSGHLTDPETFHTYSPYQAVGDIVHYTHETDRVEEKIVSIQVLRPLEGTPAPESDPGSLFKIFLKMFLNPPHIIPETSLGEKE